MNLYNERYRGLPGKRLEHFAGSVELDPGVIVVNSKFERSGSGSLSIVRAIAGSTALQLLEIIRPDREATITFPDGAIVTSVVYDAPYGREAGMPLDSRRGATAAFSPMDPEHTHTIELPDGGHLHVYSKRQKMTTEADRASVSYDTLVEAHVGPSFVDRITSGVPEALQLVQGLGALMGINEQGARILAEHALTPRLPA